MTQECCLLPALPQAVDVEGLSARVCYMFYSGCARLALARPVLQQQLARQRLYYRSVKGLSAAHVTRCAACIECGSGGGSGSLAESAWCC
jgi:hypothetical protein